MKGKPRERICDSCGIIEQVRKDNKSEICRNCSALKTLKKAHSVIANRPKNKANCTNCKKDFTRTKSNMKEKNFCSKKCHSQYVKTDRTCKKCLSTFTVFKSALSGNTNSSGNFCSRKCYNDFLCDTSRIKNYGSRWNSIRNEVFRKTPFCGKCGTLNKAIIQVHHIVPYRLTQDNRHDNLIPLCIKCHKQVEYLTCLLLNEDISTKDVYDFMSIQLRSSQCLIKKIINEKIAVFRK